MLSLVEENYLKTIYHLSEGGKTAVTTNSLAENLNNKAASVTDMVKRLSSKGMISYEKYHGANVSTRGKREALMVIRRHRLWESFLVDKLGFTWDEVHDVAEELEHIRSPLLVDKLDEFLGYPQVDPHGHPIPDKHGKMPDFKHIPLAVFPPGEKGNVSSVADGSPEFLQYLSKIGIYLGATLIILDKVTFDGSLEINIDGLKNVFVSNQVAQNLLITTFHEEV